MKSRAKKQLTMKTESEDCSKLWQPENRQRQEPNEAKTQKIQDEPAAASVTPGMRDQHFYEIKSQKAAAPCNTERLEGGNKAIEHQWRSKHIYCRQAVSLPIQAVSFLAFLQLRLWMNIRQSSLLLYQFLATLHEHWHFHHQMHVWQARTSIIWYF